MTTAELGLASTGMLANPEVEAALIGTVLNAPSVFGNVADVRSGDFAVPEHGEAWRIIGEFVRRGEAPTIDLIAPLLAPFGGGIDARALLADALSWAAAPIQASAYGRQLRDLASRRTLIALANEWATDAADLGKPLGEIAVSAIDDLGVLARLGSTGEILNREVAARLCAELKDVVPCYSSGFGSFDLSLGGGLFPGKLYGLAARKKLGKTLLLSSISYNLNVAGVPHLFLAFEMSAKEIEQRHAARFGKFNSVKYLSRDMPDISERTGEYVVQMASNVVYQDCPGATLNDIRAMIARAIHTHAIKGVILDYWQLVGGKAPKETEEWHLREVAQTLADTARKCGLWVIVAAQVNQNGNTRGGEGLKLACDQYYTLHRDKDSPWAWLEMEESRYTMYRNVGSVTEPAFELSTHGPHFADLLPRLDGEL